ncbi:hypothetical protein V495_07949, partial [Pseudogymnoascus sp. VKM F-4514 (FW-929)]
QVPAHRAHDILAHQLRGAAEHRAERAARFARWEGSADFGTGGGGGGCCAVVAAAAGHGGRGAGGGRAATGEAEDVDCVCGGGDAEEGGGEVEGHAVDCRRVRAAAELVQLVAAGHGEDADDGAGLGGGGEAGAVVVEGYAGEGGAVGFDDVNVFEG